MTIATTQQEKPSKDKILQDSKDKDPNLKTLPFSRARVGSASV